MSQSPSELPPSQRFSMEWARSLRPEERSRFQPRLTRYIPHQPFHQQAAFLLLPSREALYGGAAGGGKSDALLMAALQWVDVPGYAAILFRRTFMDLNQPDALIPRSKTWLANSDARWNTQLHEWTFPSGAVLKFGYLEHEDDVYQYQGAAFQFVGFDELTQFSETQYLYLLGRVRRPADPSQPASRVPLRVRGSANPGGRGHEWVKRRFLEEGRAKGRPFIPSKLDDNPFLDQESYRENLLELDSVRRAQLLDGNWDVRPTGNLFRREWFRIVDAEHVPRGIRWVRYWDMAATEVAKGKDPDWTAGALVGVQKLEEEAAEGRKQVRRRIWVRDVRRMRGNPGQVERFIRSTAEEDGKSVDVWIEQEPGSSGKVVIDHYVSRVLYGFTAKGNKKTGSKLDAWGPLSAQAEHGNVTLVRGLWNGWWLDEAEASPNPGVHDDGLDAVAGGMEKSGTPEVVWR